MLLRSSTGGERFEIWYYGDLLQVDGTPYIVGTEQVPSEIVARDADTGEEILLFDGTLHGYNAMFCEDYTKEQRDSRALIRWEHPPTRVKVWVACSIDYDEEREFFDFNEKGDCLLWDGRCMPWEQVITDGIDGLVISLQREDGSWQDIVNEELA